MNYKLGRCLFFSKYDTKYGTFIGIGEKHVRMVPDPNISYISILEYIPTLFELFKDNVYLIHEGKPSIEPHKGLGTSHKGQGLHNVMNIPERKILNVEVRYFFFEKIMDLPKVFVDSPAAWDQKNIDKLNSLFTLENVTKAIKTFFPTLKNESIATAFNKFSEFDFFRVDRNGGNIFYSCINDIATAAIVVDVGSKRKTNWIYYAGANHVIKMDYFFTDDDVTSERLVNSNRASYVNFNSSMLLNDPNYQDIIEGMYIETYERKKLAGTNAALPIHLQEKESKRKKQKV
jgi:hypothetical protein